jgi:hypothetical protein
MNASVHHRWINAEKIILGRLYNHPIAVLSRATRRPTCSCSERTIAAPIPIPRSSVAQAAA